MSPSASTSFATTHWSVVLAAGEQGSPESRAALEALCRAYWYPLYAYVRRRGHGAHDAQDLTQGFFLHLLGHGYLAHADPRKGRFRTFLLVALNRFLTNAWHHQRAQKRGGESAAVPWDEAEAERRYAAESPGHANPEQLFEQRWALATVERALQRIDAEFRAADRAELFAALKPVLAGEAAAEPYARLAPRFGLTEAALKMTVVRLRRRFGELLREEIASTLTEPGELDDELRHLLAVLSSPRRE